MGRIRLDAIVFDAGTQVRASIAEAVVADYAEHMTAGDAFPPVILFHDGNQYYIGDGFHRCLAAQRNHFRDIDADVRPGTKQDALWFALGANKANGQRLTEADKKHAVMLAFKAWPDRSQREIAIQIGCAQQYVQKLRANYQVTTGSHLPDRVTGRDGKSYPAHRGPNSPRPVDAPRPQTRAARAAHYESKKAMAVEGASQSSLRKLPRKADAEIVTNAMQTLSGLVSALGMVDPAALSSDPRATEWRSTITDVIAMLRTFNRHLERKSA